MVFFSDAGVWAEALRFLFLGRLMGRMARTSVWLGNSIMFRTASAFLVSPVIPGIIYALLSWDIRFFSMVMLFTLFVSYALAILVIAPLLMALYITQHYNKYTVVIVPFMVFFVLFSGYVIYSYSGFSMLEVSGAILVEEGVISPDGWLNIAVDSLTVSALAAPGGMIFYILQNIYPKIFLGEDEG